MGALSLTRASRVTLTLGCSMETAMKRHVHLHV